MDNSVETYQSVAFIIITVLLGGAILWTKNKVLSVIGAILVGLAVFAGVYLASGGFMAVAMTAFLTASLAVAYGRARWFGLWVTLVAIVIFIVLGLIWNAVPQAAFIGDYFDWLFRWWSVVAAELWSRV